MNSKRVFFVMAGVLCLLTALTIGGVVIGNSLLENKSKRLSELKLENRTLEEQQLSLNQAKVDIEKYSDLERIAKSVVPQEKDQARTVRELINIANASGIKISSVTFPSSSLGQAAQKPAATSNNTDGEATPAPKAPTAPPITQVKPVDNIKGLYQLEITMQSDSSAPVPYSKLLNFLSALEQNRRTAQVSTINVQPSLKNRDLVTFNIVINVYIKP